MSRHETRLFAYTSESSEDGLPVNRIIDTDVDDTLAALSDPIRRCSVLQEITSTGGPVLMQLQSTALPEFIGSNLKVPPGRTGANTVTEPLIVSRFDDHLAATQAELSNDGSALSLQLQKITPTDLEGGAASYTYRQGMAENALNYGIFWLHTLTQAERNESVPELVEISSNITSSVPHLRFQFSDSAGQILAVPERDFLHKRRGTTDGTIVDHADTSAGCIFFLLQKGHELPQRLPILSSGELQIS